MQNLILPPKYAIICEIGKGTFGTVYKGLNIVTNEKIAIKVENAGNDFVFLKREAQLYKLFQHIPHVPDGKWFGRTESSFFLVTDLLADTLQNRLDKGAMESTIAIHIATQMFDCIQHIHACGYIHRDLKPENFLFTSTESINLKLIDFGLCKQFKNKQGVHIPFRSGKSVIGTPNFVSVNVHEGIEPSRRDDVESLLYILCNAQLGTLPWLQSEKTSMIMLKYNFVNCLKLSEVLKAHLSKIKKVAFEEEPDYNYFKRSA